MKNDIRIFLIDTCGWIIFISIFVFFFTLWLFSYNSIDNPLKEAWTITFSALSALATLGAGIIAARLYSNWKEQENYNLRKENINAVLNIINKINYDLMHKYEVILNIKSVKSHIYINNDYLKIDLDYQQFKKEYFNYHNKLIQINIFIKKEGKKINIENFSDFYSDIERHHAEIYDRLKKILWKYDAYCKFINKKINISHHNYNFKSPYEILLKNSNFDEKKRLIRLINDEVGFYLYENKKFSLTKYDNIVDMIMHTSDNVKKIEKVLTDLLIDYLD